MQGQVVLPQMGRLGQAHILLATLGVAVFAFAAVLAIVYLFQDRSLKRKQLDRVVARGTPLETLDRLAHRCVAIGFPVFTLAIVTGAIWVARLGLLPAGLTVRCRMAVPRDPIGGAGCGRIGSAPAVGRRVTKAATAVSMFLAVHLNVPNRAWSVSAMPSLRSILLN